MTPKIEDKNTMFSDFVEYFIAPIKYRHSREIYDSTFLSIGQRSTFKKLIGLVFALCLVSIVWLRFIYSFTPFYPPIYSASHEISFVLAFILLNSTAFFISTAAQYLVFRAFSGKAELLVQAYLTVIGSSWTMISAVLSTFVLFIVRVKNIDAWILGIVSIYLLFVMFYSLRALHHVSTTRAVLAFILSIIVSVPIIILYFMLLSFLIEARPYNLSDTRLMLFLWAALFIDLTLLGYMFYEQKKRQLFPLNGGEQSVFKIALKSKPVKFFSIVLAILLIVIYGQYAFKTTRTAPEMIENSSVIALSYDVVDAAFSPELNSIVLISTDPNQLHIFDTVTGNQTSVDLPFSPSIFSINQAGTHAVIEGDKIIAYLDLVAMKLIDVFETNEDLFDLALNDRKIYYSYSDAPNGAKLAVIDTLTGTTFYSEQRLINTQLFTNNQRLYQVGSHSLFEMRILPNSNVPEKAELVFDFQLKAIWFSNNSERFVSNTGHVFEVGKEEDRTEHIGEIEGFGGTRQIIAMSHSQPTGKYLLFSSTEPGLILVDEETLERKETTSLPEIEFNLWTDDYFPRFVSRYFAPIGLYVFADNEQAKYYAVVTINVKNTDRRFAIVSGEF